MKYLDSKPFNIAVRVEGETRPQVVENGGPATRIPEDAKCPSGRHNTRLTECYCPKPALCDVNGKPYPPCAERGVDVVHSIIRASARTFIETHSK